MKSKKCPSLVKTLDFTFCSHSSSYFTLFVVVLPKYVIVFCAFYGHFASLGCFIAFLCGHFVYVSLIFVSNILHKILCNSKNKLIHSFLIFF